MRTVRRRRKSSAVAHEAGDQKRSRFGQTNTDEEREKRTWNGVLYGSVTEMQYAQTLRKQLNAGHLVKVEEQVIYRLKVNGIRLATWTADFRVTHAGGRVEIHEVKPWRAGNRDWPIKEALIAALVKGWPKSPTFHVWDGKVLHEIVAPKPTPLADAGPVKRSYRKG